MGKIEELIKKKCGGKVEYKKLSEVLDYEQPGPYIVSDTKYDDSYDIPVLTAGQSFILGYTNEKEGIYKASKQLPVIIFDDFTTSKQWVDFDFKVKSSAMKILSIKKCDKYYQKMKYIYYCICNIKYIPSAHSRQWIETFSQFTIPYPPLEVQEKIVKILDSFTELTAELTARKKQYEYYRDLILSFDKERYETEIREFVNILDSL